MVWLLPPRHGPVGRGLGGSRKAICRVAVAAQTGIGGPGEVG